MTDRRPTRSTPAGRAYLDLQNLARRLRRPTDELHQLYALEGFLSRLAASEHADRLVLKGGVLLAAYETRRPTRDVDLYARQVPNDIPTVLRTVREIAALPQDDGLDLAPETATAESIRDEDEYSGVRVTLTGRLSAARIAFHVDVNVGDPVQPAPRRVVLPRLLGGRLEVTGYPLPMVHAEKIVTAVQRGAGNTRWRDFADVHALCLRHVVDGDELRRSVVTVSEHRRVVLTPLATALAGYPAVAQAKWAAWRRRQRLDDRLPEEFADVLGTVAAFADPVLTGRTSGLSWDPGALSWR
ncbi:nucleotidyl transferase AbiEii/AbiGii toxin family protein [Streptomyces thermolineatus]|uniref:Nucleotidyl transferase AbiEii/AbiGii toxin family protein n=1 Tax=Streptomyces thermolineatus TaxID=44033 RepID=A0ABP6A392_9ACTN